MPPCTSTGFFRPYPMEYNKDDEDLYHEFRKCMFSRRIKGGKYVFKSKTSGDHMTYEISKGRLYERSYGVLYGTPIRIEV